MEYYSLLPTMGEPEIVHAAVPGGASVLELGCGTGRILRPLAALGHRVHGVDESPAMLERMGGLPATLARLQDVRLDRTFDVVLLASTTLNGEPSLRRAFLATCRHHVDPGGLVVFQQNAPAWFDAVTESSAEIAGIRRVVRSALRHGDRVDLVVDYHVGDRTWTHEFPRYAITSRELARNLREAGLRFDGYLTEDRSWFTARPV
ncbi:class I SAM-dependent methyltransferase [Amorphoplanes digitatis]|uniref:SAM-dependent methyltransferase n=1 Tax=Actinoplanes digitatis TaxID=1868 RepID=A0A7W7MRC7_9ACTN|nr:class I SAM-dependent methyltransferase [Actinoplanes digitatis]MBB4763354.1 SAM-dependent methyltransferase [Actinoplanes digitatis]